MQLDAWSIITIVIVVIGFFGGIWYVLSSVSRMHS